MLPPPSPPPLPHPGLLQTPASKHAPEQKPNTSLYVPTTGPPNSVSLSLLIYNGWPFANHWEYYTASPIDPNIGVVMQAAGNVRKGFWLEIKRGWDISLPEQKPDQIIGLGWVAGTLVEPLETVFRVGEDVVIEQEPKCQLERMLFKVPAPGKTLRDVIDDHVSLTGCLAEPRANNMQIDRRVRIMQRNCQTWVVETSELLVKEGILEQQVMDYLLANKQY
ncbi:hypothetical protein QBC36DRAFT_331633 [Triangularia setosa]|uniref:Uncharacterized protein n=1 Tax=Triangularia setosa TaxID=2587417 RepID=A0AAN7A6S8_9PEZI|nr:hypothetical protein QBC36DRAFT_331633 [Podospora setosa]